MSEPIRCGWCGDDPLYQRYHDEEWGVPSRDERHLFEMLILEGAQAGLSWLTILRKREGYRDLFAGFDVEAIARYGPDEIAACLQDPRIVRNRLKVESTVANAQATLALYERGRRLADLLWDQVDGQPVQNRWQDIEEIPPSTPASDALSKRLKHLGFKFVGTRICYALMQSVGMVNDHVLTCHRYQAVARTASECLPRRWRWSAD